MTKEERARRYLQADMNASYTGLPREQREAYEDVRKGHEREYPGVRRHALVGTDRDFDQPLAAGEREHQRHMRRQEELTEHDVTEGRRELRQGRREHPTRPTPGRRASGSSSRSRAGRAFQQTGLSGAAGDTGAFVMKVIGWGIGLTVVYLVLSDRGAGAFSGLLEGVGNGLRIFLGPIDPLNPSGKAGASKSSSAAPGEELTPEPGPVPKSTVRAQRKSLRPTFGPAPGIPNRIGGHELSTPLITTGR